MDASLGEQIEKYVREISDNVATNLRELTSKDYSEMSVGEGMVIGFGGLAVLCCCGVCLYCLQLSRKKSPSEANKRGEANKKGVPTQDLIDLHNNNTIEGGLEVEKKPGRGQGSVDLLDLDDFGGVGAEMVSQETGEDRKDEGLEGLGGNEGAGESPAAFFSSTQTGRRQLLVGETSEHFEEIGVTPKRYSKTRPSRLFVKQPGDVHTADVAADGDSSWITDPSNDTLAESETKL